MSGDSSKFVHSETGEVTLRRQDPVFKDGDSADDTIPTLDTSRFQDLAIGEEVGGYRIEGKLGRGGFGAVYAAEHAVIGKKVAIKVFRYSTDAKAAARFINEARTVNQIRHPNIIDIFGFGELGDGRQYYIMEQLQGRTLAKYLDDKGPLELGELISIMRGITGALGAAHAIGVVHRDLSPDNIFLVESPGRRPFPKILDFGLAKLLGDVDRSYRTNTGALLGTPRYMSPEQCRGRPLDHRSDIYALGVVIYELLTGKPPFDASKPMAIMLKHLGDEPEPPSRLRSDLMWAVDRLVLRMLAKEPDDRVQDCGAVMHLLEEAVEGSGTRVRAATRTSGAQPALTYDESPAEESRPTIVRPAQPGRLWPAALVAAIIVGIVVGIVNWLMG